jgi:L-arabinokinase
LTIAFYISGHGFGHASRQIEIINALAARRPDLRILIRSAAARWLLDRTVKPPFDLDPQPVDTGVAQIDSLHLDAATTIAEARDFYSTLDARADEEARRLVERNVVFVVADAPPLACAAAARAGVPSVVISNFTWDWIYEGYEGDGKSEGAEGDSGFIEAIRKAYRQADAAWRLPMHGGFTSFKSVVDVPFVARHAKHARQETRQRLRLPSNRRLVLPTFGGYGVEGLKLDALDVGDAWHVVHMPDAAIYDAGLRYEDLVRAVDVVVTKPGYGILSECIANDTAVVYTSRGRFAEYDVLVREMPKYLRSVYLDNESLLAGRWRAALDTAVSAPEPPQHPRTDGAVIVADMICARVERRLDLVGTPGVGRRFGDARSS